MSFPVAIDQLHRYAEAHRRTAHGYATAHETALTLHFTALAERTEALIGYLERGIIPQVGVLILSPTFAVLSDVVIDTTTLWRDVQAIPGYAGHEACAQGSHIKHCIKEAYEVPHIERDLWSRLRSSFRQLQRHGYAVPDMVLARTPRERLVHEVFVVLRNQHDYLCRIRLGPDVATDLSRLSQHGRYLAMDPDAPAAFDGCERQVGPLSLRWAGDAALICATLATAGLPARNVPTTTEQPMVIDPANTTPII